MAINARIKGSTGEREACALLSKLLGIGQLTRNLEQVRSGGADIVDVPGLCIEVKRCEATHLDAWWRQACAAAQERGTLPVLMYRRNRRPWSFCLPASLLLPGLDGYIQLGEPAFAGWARHWLKEQPPLGGQ